MVLAQQLNKICNQMVEFQIIIIARDCYIKFVDVQEPLDRLS